MGKERAADASGRYNGNFLWGNNYWLGSAVHCKNVEPEPPFKLGFYVFRARIYLSGTMAAAKANRTAAQGILVGVCLPISCSNEEAQEILNFSINSAGLDTYRTVELSPVKNPNSVYELTSDPVFWTLFSFTLIILVLALIGTAKSPEIPSPVNELKIPAGANNNDNSEGESSERNSVNSEEVVGKFTRIWKEVLISFSLKRNFSTICERSVGEDTIPTIHGLRSISMAWVILGHTCIIAFKYADNPAYRLIVEKELIFQTINKGAYSVDTFFFISGLLVSYLYFRTTSKHDITKYTKTTGFTSGLLEFISLIGYRFARLTAPYFFVLGCVQVSMKWFYHNSVFEPPTLDHVNCPQYWWRNLLYINTLFPVQEMCMLWSWYLADDTQFYVLGVILLILAVKYFKAAAALMAFFLVSSWFTTGFIAYSNNHIPNEDDPLALFDKIYDKPWTRLGPYIVGMSVGWLLFKTNCKIKMNKATVITGWTLTLSLLLYLVYGLFGTKLHPITAATFSSLSHTAWALGLSWIVIACSTGYGGYISDILSSSLLYPFSRVTYCAYLVHPVVIRTVTMRLDAPLHLSPEMVVSRMFFYPT
nr:nose resistant to fluoxetine protein 6 [Halyomorpha halys]